MWGVCVIKNYTALLDTHANVRLKTGLTFIVQLEYNTYSPVAHQITHFRFAPIKVINIYNPQPPK